MGILDYLFGRNLTDLVTEEQAKSWAEKKTITREDVTQLYHSGVISRDEYNELLSSN